jgi:hypothetical protein
MCLERSHVVVSNGLQYRLKGDELLAVIVE